MEALEEDINKGPGGDKENVIKSNLLDILAPSERVLPYKHATQSTPVGCGVVSFLMGLSGIDNSYTPSAQDEQMWVKKLRRMGGGIPTFELMRLVDMYNLKMDILFQNSISDFDENSPLVRNYKKTVSYMKDKGTLSKYQEKVTINFDLIKSHIDQGRYLMINGIVGTIPHMRLCFGYKGDKLLIADPLCSNIQEYAQQEFAENCSPPFGKRFISLYK